MCQGGHDSTPLAVSATAQKLMICKDALKTKTQISSNNSQRISHAAKGPFHMGAASWFLASCTATINDFGGVS